MGKREQVALLNLSSWCLVMAEWLFLADAMGLSAVCDCGISWSYSLTILNVTNSVRQLLCVDSKGQSFGAIINATSS